MCSGLRKAVLGPGESHGSEDTQARKIGAGEMARLLKCLLNKQEDLSLDSRNQCKIWVSHR